MDDLRKAQQSKPYLAAVERGTDDDRAAMKRLIDAALFRVEAAEEPERELAPADDDTFPGDR